MAKCPNCDKLLTNVTYETTRIGPLLSTEGFYGLIYLCPYCQHVLGVGMDPIAIKTDAVNETTEAVANRLGPTLQQMTNALNHLLSRKG